MTNTPIISKSKDGKHELKFFESSHRYYLDGKSVKSVTGVGSVYPKGDALTKWKIEQGIRSALKECERDCDDGEEGTTVLYDKVIEELVGKHTMAYTKISKQAASLGTLVHDYMYCLDVGKEDEAAKILKQGKGREDHDQFNNAIVSADSYRAGNTDKLLLAEAIVASPGNRVAGKFDLLVKRGADTGIKDYKTSKGIYIDQFQQCATYGILTSEWLDITANFYEIIHLNKTNGKLNIARMDTQGLWFNNKLVIEDAVMLYDQVGQAMRNIGTAHYQSKYKDFWKKVR